MQSSELRVAYVWSAHFKHLRAVACREKHMLTKLRYILYRLALIAKVAYMAMLLKIS